MRSLSTFFKKEEKSVLHQVDALNHSLTLLRYEGKLSRAQNVKIATREISLLTKTLKEHRSLQEKVIFPFLLRHIPKKEPVIGFLRSDHRMIREYKIKLKALLVKISKNANAVIEAGKIQETGIYLVSLLRHHIEMEKENIEKTIRAELDKDEKKDFERQINRWLKQHNNGKR